MVNPLRLARVFSHDGETIVSLRPASDGYLDCSMAYTSQYMLAGGTSGTWRDLCIDTDTWAVGQCSTMQASYAFSSIAEVSFAEFVARYAPKLDVSQYLAWGRIPTVHVAWQHYRGDVVSFRLDFAMEDCAVLIDAPLTTPVPVGGVDIPSFFSWDRPQSFQCQVAA